MIEERIEGNLFHMLDEETDSEYVKSYTLCLAYFSSFYEFYCREWVFAVLLRILFLLSAFFPFYVIIINIIIIFSETK